MSNSTLASYVQISPNCNKGRIRNGKKIAIKKITIHHMAGSLTLQQFGALVARPARQMSATYAIDKNGNIGRYLDEADRPWTSSSPDNDYQAITVEVANDGGAPNWHVSNASIAALINLCVDVCKRNGIAKLNFTGDKSGNLTQHCYFTNTACPGPYLKSKFKYIAGEVNKRLSGGAQQAMPSKPATQPPAGCSGASTSKKCAAAKSFSKSVAGTYTATGNVYMRYVPGQITSDNIVCTVKVAEQVRCYGYYTTIGGVKWFYCAYAGKVGYISGKYLKKS